MKKRNITVDTNVIQCLYLLNSGNADNIIKDYSGEQINVLNKLLKNLDKYCIHITPKVEAEIKEYAKFNPGIVVFVEGVLKIKKAKPYSKNPLLKQHILNLQQEYLKEDILLKDTTRKPQSALISEKKKGQVDNSDSLIVAENSVLYGYPLFTLNDKHLISMNEASDKHKSYRSMAILKKNEVYLKKVPHAHKIVRKNLKAQHSTTFRISRVFDSELYL